MNYWIFKCNPEKYDVTRRMKDPEPGITWLVSRYKDEIKKGDFAFLWQTGSDRGIIGAMAVDSSPRLIDEMHNELQYCKELNSGLACRVTGRLIARTKLLPSVHLREVSGLEHLSVFHGFQMATNFRITHQEGDILGKMLGIKAL